MEINNLSYHLVEAPARISLTRLSFRWSALALVSVATVVAITAMGIRFQEGVAGRFSEETEIASREAFNKNPRRSTCLVKEGAEPSPCIFGGNELNAILIGDSHADALVTALAAAETAPEKGILSWTYSGCPTLFGVKTALRANSSNCSDFLKFVTLKIAEIPKSIPAIIINRSSAYAMGYNEPWEENFEKPLVYFTKKYTTPSSEFLEEFSQHLTETACQLAKDRTVYLMRPIPEMGVDIPKKMSRSLLLGEKIEPSILLTDYYKRHAVVFAAQDAARERCGIKILDPLPYLCTDDRCDGSREGRPLYSDDDHLSEHGNKLLVPMFSAVFAPPSPNELAIQRLSKPTSPATASQ